MPSMLRGLLVLLFVCGAQNALGQGGEPSVEDLLSKVSNALRTSDFRGRLTYEYSGKLEIVEISHTVIDGVEHDRIYYLNGPSRALVKNGRSADCLNHGRTLMQGGKVRLSSGGFARLDSSYNFKLLGSERVAGRNSWVVQILPKDNYRHGVIIAIDQQSYLPTKTLFVANNSKVLERLHFVALETRDETENTADLAGQVEPGEASASKLQTPCETDHALDSGSQWQPGWVPSGFVLARYEYTDADGHMETYTDGLASFSVFTKPIIAAGADRRIAPSTFKKGATAAVMRILPDIASSPVHVSVLGEIPAETASRILSSVKSADS